jgi:hypothetical protein
MTSSAQPIDDVVAPAPDDHILIRRPGQRVCELGNATVTVPFLTSHAFAAVLLNVGAIETLSPFRFTASRPVMFMTSE